MTSHLQASTYITEINPWPTITTFILTDLVTLYNTGLIYQLKINYKPLKEISRKVAETTQHRNATEKRLL